MSWQRSPGDAARPKRYGPGNRAQSLLPVQARWSERPVRLPEGTGYFCTREINRIADRFPIPPEERTGPGVSDCHSVADLLLSIRIPMRPADHHTSHRPAFTLIELLIVIAVIAVLAALLLPAIARAKESAHSATCRSNVHQLGLALTLYLGDYHHYPGAAPSAKMPGGYWHDYLTPYCSRRWIDPVFRCPSYRGLTLAPKGVLPLGSYGYNANGVEWWFSDLGLSAINVNDGSTVPMPEGRIVNPSEMTALGDANLYSVPGHVLRDLYHTNAQDSVSGWSLLDITAERATQSAGSVERERIGRAGRLRHRGRSQVLFCDGHVESPLNRLLFSTDAPRLRRWNNDNEPHPEALAQ